MNRPLFIIFSTTALDAIGIGLIFPILPALLQDITHSSSIALYMGMWVFPWVLLVYAKCWCNLLYLHMPLKYSVTVKPY